MHWAFEKRLNYASISTENRNSMKSNTWRERARLHFNAQFKWIAPGAFFSLHLLTYLLLCRTVKSNTYFLGSLVLVIARCINKTCKLKNWTIDVRLDSASLSIVMKKQICLKKIGSRNEKCNTLQWHTLLKWSAALKISTWIFENSKRHGKFFRENLSRWQHNAINHIFDHPPADLMFTSGVCVCVFASTHDSVIWCENTQTPLRAMIWL